MPEIIFSLTPDGEITFLNSAFEKLTGWSRDEWIGKLFTELLCEEEKWKFRKAFREPENESLNNPLNIMLKLSTGGHLTAEVIARPQVRGGKVVRVLGTVRDITERKKADEQIQKSLKEKEFLLKEIHHRVKNNLQIISSLLSLQSDYVKGKDTLALFNECQNRISAIALIHEQLYQSSDITEINMADYVTTLTTNLLDVFDNDGCSIDVSIDSDDISVDINTAVPCGLIISELFSNCLKHAFRPPGKALMQDKKIGTVSIEIRTDGNQNIVLSVTDDGIGFPGRLNFRKTKTLGLQLICALTEQLNGTIELRNQKGTAFIIKFPEKGNRRVV